MTSTTSATPSPATSHSSSPTPSEPGHAAGAWAFVAAVLIEGLWLATLAWMALEGMAVSGAIPGVVPKGEVP